VPSLFLEKKIARTWTLDAIEDEFKGNEDGVLIDVAVGQEWGGSTGGCTRMKKSQMPELCLQSLPKSASDCARVNAENA